jgi:glutaredoxin-related protein
MSRLHKDVLFFSQHCPHCQTALDLLHAARQPFVAVDIAACPPATLPAFVDRVPLMVLRDMTLVVDASLFGYLRTLTNGGGVNAGDAAATSQQLAAAAATDPEPFSEELSGVAYSDRYTFLAPTENTHTVSADDDCAPRQFAFLAYPEQSIHTPSDDSDAYAAAAKTGGRAST